MSSFGDKRVQVLQLASNDALAPGVLKLILPNGLVRVRFGTNQSVQILEKGGAGNDEDNKSSIG
jgi:hypothetical protein